MECYLFQFLIPVRLEKHNKSNKTKLTDDLNDDHGRGNALLAFSRSADAFAECTNSD